MYERMGSRTSEVARIIQKRESGKLGVSSLDREGLEVRIES